MNNALQTTDYELLTVLTICNNDCFAELTSNGELGAGDVRSTHHPVVALVCDLATLNFQQMALSTHTDVVLEAGVQFLGALVPGQHDFGVVDLHLTFKQSLLVN